VKDLLRRYPEVAEAALAAVAAISPADVEEPEARAAFVWILGHHGGHIQVRLPARAPLLTLLLSGVSPTADCPSAGSARAIVSPLTVHS